MRKKLAFLTVSISALPFLLGIDSCKERELQFSNGIDTVWFSEPRNLGFLTVPVLTGATDTKVGLLESAPACAKFSEPEPKFFAKVQDELINYGNDLQKRNSAPQANGDSGIAAKYPVAMMWVSTVADTDFFKIAYTNKVAGENASLAFQIKPDTLGVDLNFERKNQTVSLVMASQYYSVLLRADADNCIRATLCAKVGEANKIRYLTEAFYGSQLGLEISDSTIKSNDEIRLAYGAYGLSLKFKISRQNVGISTFIMGSQPKKQDSWYDVPDLIEDINAKRFMAARAKWDKNIDRLAFIGGRWKEVSLKSCQKEKYITE